MNVYVTLVYTSMLYITCWHILYSFLTRLFWVIYKYDKSDYQRKVLVSVLQNNEICIKKVLDLKTLWHHDRTLRYSIHNMFSKLMKGFFWEILQLL